MPSSGLIFTKNIESQILYLEATVVQEPKLFKIYMTKKDLEIIDSSI